MTLSANNGAVAVVWRRRQEVAREVTIKTRLGQGAVRSGKGRGMRGQVYEQREARGKRSREEAQEEEEEIIEAIFEASESRDKKRERERLLLLLIGMTS